LLVLILSAVVLIINIMAFYSRNVTAYLYLFDLTYAVGNSAHFVALSISSNGISIEDEKRVK
jgi:hypothetical protein